MDIGEEITHSWGSIICLSALRNGDYSRSEALGMLGGKTSIKWQQDHVLRGPPCIGKVLCGKCVREEAFIVSFKK
jgi:hypothetical protein